MNAAEIRNFVETAAGESAKHQIEDYIDDGDDFVLLDETDTDLKCIMENESIRDKVGAFADVLWNDEGFLMDHLGDGVYKVKTNDGRKKLIESLSKVSNTNHDAWNNVLAKLEKELINA